MTFSYSLDDELSQGDIIRNVRVMTSVVGGEGNAPKYKNSNIIVISRNCEISKPAKSADSVLVARVRRLTEQSTQFQDKIRGNMVLNTFYLPSNERLGEEGFIDWRSLQPVDKTNLYNLRSSVDNYKCTLTGELLKACLGGLLIFLTKAEDEEG